MLSKISSFWEIQRKDEENLASFMQNLVLWTKDEGALTCLLTCHMSAIQKARSGLKHQNRVFCFLNISDSVI